MKKTFRGTIYLGSYDFYEEKGNTRHDLAEMLSSFDGKKVKLTIEHL